MNEIINLRKILHQHPELAFNENKTREIITSFMAIYKPDEFIFPIAKTGFAFVFKGDPQKPVIAFRADLDALKITEESACSYKSQHEGYSHSCGHDGHMAMVCGIAPHLNDDKLIKNRGDIVLLFQPAEEIGAGAKQMAEDENFLKLHISYIFGLHNLPNYNAGCILTRKNVFSCSSVGLKIKIKGNSAHAAYPENALSPARYIPFLIDYSEQVNARKINQLLLFTMTHVKLGEQSFGITPGELEAYFTLRSDDESLLLETKDEFITAIKSHVDKEFDIKIEEHDYFPETKNNQEAVDLIQKASDNLGIEFEYLPRPMRWSEDFGYFTKKIKGAYFGLGTGESKPLHHQEYDFNDEVLEVGIKLYNELIKLINN